MRLPFVLTMLLAASLAFVVPAHAGLIINATFDSTITGDANAASIEATIEMAVQTFEELYTNPITVSILFQRRVGGWGKKQRCRFPACRTPFSTAGSWPNNANPAAIAALNANGGNPNTNGGVNPVGGIRTRSRLRSANARALGIDIPAGCVSDRHRSWYVQWQCSEHVRYLRGGRQGGRHHQPEYGDYHSPQDTDISPTRSISIYCPRPNMRSTKYWGLAPRSLTATRRVHPAPVSLVPLSMPRMIHSSTWARLKTCSGGAPRPAARVR